MMMTLLPWTKADPLADHDPQIFDAELVYRLGAKLVAGRNQVRVECRLAPDNALKLIERPAGHPWFVSLGLTINSRAPLRDSIGPSGEQVKRAKCSDSASSLSD
jgi:hypothetical protein